MVPLRNFTYGGGCTTASPPEKSSYRSKVKDCYLRKRNKVNTEVWIDRQSKSITAAYGESWQPRLPARSVLSRNHYNWDGYCDVEKDDQTVHDDAIEDPVGFLKYTTLLDAKSDESVPVSQRPRRANLCRKDALMSLRNDLKNKDEFDKSAEPYPFEITGIDLLPGVPKLSSVEPQCEAQPHDQPWQIDDQEHLLVSDYLSAQLFGLNLAPCEFDDKKDLPLCLQCALIAKLARENRQLDAFQEALQFALNDAFKHTNGVAFTAKVRLYDYAVGVSYPIIDICMDQWIEGTELQCYLAYYLLRGMLKRYSDLPFPDRVDIRELGLKCARLLVPYGAGRAEADSEGERVRSRIIGEMRLRGGPTGKDRLEIRDSAMSFFTVTHMRTKRADENRAQTGGTVRLNTGWTKRHLKQKPERPGPDYMKNVVGYDPNYVYCHEDAPEDEYALIRDSEFGHLGWNEVYDVLWVEWFNGIAYRKGSGVVYKEIWETHDLEDVDLILG
ncbi:hypothetical protein NPX13_g2008 [Xylaria arbuscula]|uniref:Uncharacterized protein n=1 Tax=Xylaria arbuscula TaxID=114810 RepID=A0A9W8NKV4_9PEZI|nr:hypothetical protein NPX13_g2008 [Xylaria arbuscula]